MSELNIPHLLNASSDILFMSRSPARLQGFLDLAVLQQPQIGFISERFPLLSNLSVLENIVLHRMYKNNFPLHRSLKSIQHLISALEMGKVLENRKESLSGREKVNAFFLRCIASGNRIAILESPSVQTYQLCQDSRSKTNAELRFWLTSLESEAPLYKHFGLETIKLGEER